MGNHNKPYITDSDQNTDLENLAIDSQVAFFKDLECYIRKGTQITNTHLENSLWIVTSQIKAD